MARRTLRAATRRSNLARTQAKLVGGLLHQTHVGIQLELVEVETTGDRVTDVSISEVGETGVFVKEVQAAVLEGRADIAVHSAKDLPSAPTSGLVIAAVPPRDDPRDALVGSTLDSIPTGGRIGTGSVRRRAQLAWLRPDLTFGNLRGNIETRLEKAGDFAAIVVAAAALRRLGRSTVMAEILDVGRLVPQAAQGALAIECRSDDAETIALLLTIQDERSRRAVDAERAYLREMGSGCDSPVGAHAVAAREGDISLTGLVATADGRIVLRHTDEHDDPVELGRRVARHLLDDAGGSMVLAEGAPSVQPAEPLDAGGP
ncbi:MAG: hydroxymethylbilane synthase [Actinomycetota bacterium]|nr:hydroxymethylbilane synthase [Actinomycetota bacterium]